MLRKPLGLLCLLFLAASDVSGAQAVVRHDAALNAQPNWSGTWSARTGSGRTLMGTWTAVPDPTSGTVTGTWALVDAQGTPVANGAWSAAKSLGRWSGAWRAVIAGRDGEYSGTWTAGVDLKVDAQLVDLFEKAIQTVVSGNWRAGSQSGAWSIRASKGEGGPASGSAAFVPERSEEHVKRLSRSGGGGSADTLSSCDARRSIVFIPTEHARLSDKHATGAPPQVLL